MECYPTPCKTCPFEGGNPGGINVNYYIQNIANFRASHLCHSTDNKTLCRGARNIQIKIAYAIGMIDTPTDEALQAALIKYGKGKGE